MSPLNFGKFFRSPTPAERYKGLDVRSDVAAAAAVMATDPRSDRTIKLVGDILPESEIVINMVEGRHQKIRGLAVLTTKRVLFIGHNYLRGPLAQIPLSDLSPDGLQATGTRLELRPTSGPVVVDQMLGNSASIFAAALERALLSPDEPRRRDPLDLLAEVRALHDSGVMTDAEFAVEKARLMDQI